MIEVRHEANRKTRKLVAQLLTRRKLSLPPPIWVNHCPPTAPLRASSSRLSCGPDTSSTSCCSLPSISRCLSVPLPAVSFATSSNVFYRRRKTVAEQITSVVGCTVERTKDPKIGAPLHTNYWDAQKRDWEGFVARCREIERNGCNWWPNEPTLTMIARGALDRGRPPRDCLFVRRHHLGPGPPVQLPRGGRRRPAQLDRRAYPELGRRCEAIWGLRTPGGTPAGHE